MFEKLKNILKYIDPYFYMDLFINYLHNKGIKNKALDVTIYIVYSLILAIILLKILALLLGTGEAMMIVVSESMEPNLNIGDIAVLVNPEIINPGQEINVDLNLKNKPISQFVKINYGLRNEIINNKNVGLVYTESIEIDNNIYPIKQEGDVIVYYTPLLKKKIIHRAIFKINANDGSYYITKGDNKTKNTLIDQDCGALPNGQITKECITVYPIEEDKVLAKYWFKIPYLGYIKILPVNLINWLFS